MISFSRAALSSLLCIGFVIARSILVSLGGHSGIVSAESGVASCCVLYGCEHNSRNLIWRARFDATRVATGGFVNDLDESRVAPLVPGHGGVNSRSHRVMIAPNNLANRLGTYIFWQGEISTEQQLTICIIEIS